MDPEPELIRHVGEIPSITSLCEACDTLDLVPVLLKEGKYAAELEEDIYHQMTVKDILNRPECDLCQYALRILTSMAASAKSSTIPPPLPTVKNALIILHVRCDLRNEVLPCRALELRLDRYIENSLYYELLPACPDPGALRGNGRTIARIPAETINPSIVCQWIRQCQEHHSKTCYVRTKKSFDFDLWAIDVMDMKLSKLSADDEYLALSYVWGQTVASVSTEENLRARSTPGGLRQVVEKSSRTVQDAANLTSGMGIRYLWIDQLCVIRGDDNLLHRTLRAMGDIYHHAIATIVAADGSDANSGLSGVRGGPRRPQSYPVILESGRSRMALIKSPRTKYLDDSTYLRRAWT